MSNPAPVADEATIINGLFDEGLEILHLRKPESMADEIRKLVEKIKPEYYQRIALHQHHELAEKFGLQRLHFTEIHRKRTTRQALKQLKTNNYTLSTSIHQLEAYTSVSAVFDYVFFGPVFDSISKQGYKSNFSGDFNFRIKVNRPKLVAIGGIDATTIQLAIRLKFNGVAVLGSIWQKPGESIQQFKTLQQAWEQTGR